MVGDNAQVLELPDYNSGVSIDCDTGMYEQSM
jgi:hypothetical protein